jgi:hypothetical protein
MRRPVHPAIRHCVLVGLVVLPIPALPPAVDAAPNPGFVETWPGTSVQGWSGGATYSNPGTGGVGGAGDGFLIMSTGSVANLGGMSAGPEYMGNWQAAGITSVRVWLNDVGADEALEIHFGLGNSANFWQYNIGFQPPSQSWQEFTVNLTMESDWTRTIGSGSFDAALQNVNRVLIRHDMAPYVMTPDQIQGDVGIDNLTLSELATPTRTTRWGRIKALYR